MLTIIAAIVPLAVKVIGYFFDKGVVNAELKAQWIQFVLSMQDHGIISSNLRDSYQKQLADLNKPKAP